jgi:predicted SnoaL-like aldol condensation-catalyzing enzyme
VLVEIVRPTWYSHSSLEPITSKEASMRRSILLALAGVALSVGHAKAQEPVVGAPDVEKLFTSKNPVLHRNKQAAYHIEKDLLAAGHWELADKWLTERYIQHNPNAASGRAGVVAYFTQVLKVQPKPIPAKLDRPVVAVVAEGDLVTVITPRTMKDPKDSTRSYTTSWFDMWRFVNGKADEHWDGAVKGP